MSTIGISITKNAWSKIKHIIQISHNNLGFIFSASSGGCNGFNFNLKLLDQQTFNEINDRVINDSGETELTNFNESISDV